MVTWRGWSETLGGYGVLGAIVSRWAFDMVTVPIPVGSKPGIQRDGTVLAGERYADGVWVRFARGYPRKMAGYQQLNSNLSGTPRGLDAFPHDDHVHVHVGSQNVLERLNVDVNTLASAGISDRTPAGFTTNANNAWQFAQMYDSVSTDVMLIAHAAQNAVDVANDTGAPVYYGDIHATTVLTAIASSTVSGGVVILHPYLFVFGSDGYVRHSVANQPGDLTGAGSGGARITAKKVIRGLPVRGGAGNAPAGLFWSLDSLIKASFVGGTPVFDYDTISAELNVMSALSIIEFDGVFYWVDLERFMMYNGIVQEVFNDTNKNFFFDNLNRDHQAKVFSFKVPRFNEWWICFPYGSSTECNWAMIYNKELKTWYDTPLPNGGRGAAVNAAGFRYPLMSGVTADPTTAKMRLWAHEIGYDEVSGSPATTNAIQSYFETNVLSLVTPPPGGNPQDKWLRASVLEPDFTQTGNMTVTVRGRTNARAGDVDSTAQTILQTPTIPAEQIVTFKDAMRRQMRLRFESNVAGGFYEMGKPILHVEPGDGSILGAL